jgi:hypothetical protein
VSSDQKQLKGGHQAQVHSDQMVLMIAEHGGWTTMRWWPKTQIEANIKGDYMARLYSGQAVLVVVRQGG